VAHHLSYPEPFIREGLALGERPHIGMAPGNEGTGEYRWQDGKPEALVALYLVEGLYGLLIAVDRPTIVTLGLVGDAEEYTCQGVQDDIPTGCSKDKSTLGGSYGLTICAAVMKID
jgi:hypothetical protein